MLIEIKFGSFLSWSFDSPNQVRRLGEISQLIREDQESIPHLAERIKGLALHAIPTFAETVSSLTTRLLSGCKDWLNLFPDLKGDYTPVLPINSLLESHRERGETGKDREEIGSRSRIPSKRALLILCSLIPRTKREGSLIRRQFDHLTGRIVKGIKWLRADQIPTDTLSQKSQRRSTCNFPSKLLVI